VTAAFDRSAGARRAFLPREFSVAIDWRVNSPPAVRFPRRDWERRNLFLLPVPGTHPDSFAFRGQGGGYQKHSGFPWVWGTITGQRPPNFRLGLGL